ncbi:MAG: polysaccharide deacetylase family protein [Candidatus Paceibacterota bacterium]
MKKFLKVFLNKIYPRLTKGASVLMYHSIAANNAFFTVTPENFEKQMKYLSESGLKIIPLSRLIDMFLKKEDISSCVSLTFDDGYLDNLQNVLPVLRKYNIKASIFIAPKLLGTKFTTSDKVILNIFTEDDFEKMGAGSNFEILPHSFSHKELPSLSKEEIQTELSGCVEFLSKKGDTRKILAYPRGKYSKEVTDVLFEEGWEAAVTTLPGLLTHKIERFLIPRNFVGRFTDMKDFKMLISDGVYYYAKVRLWFLDLLKKS